MIMNLNLSLVFSIISLGIALVALVLSLKENGRRGFELKMTYLSNLLNWYEQTIEFMIKIEQKVIKGEDATEDLAKFSAIIDYGRFYFPNRVDGTWGNDKPLAFQGFRDTTLDFLVAYYNLFAFGKHDSYPKNAALKIRQMFTSKVFEVANNMNYIKEAKTYVGTSMTESELGEYLKNREEAFIYKLVFDKAFTERPL